MRLWISATWRFLTASDPDNPVAVPLDENFRRARRNTHVWSLAALVVGLYATQAGEVATPLIPIELPPIGAAIGAWLVALHMGLEYLREYRPIDRSMRKLFRDKKADSISGAVEQIEAKMQEVIKKGTQFDTQVHGLRIQRDQATATVGHQIMRIANEWDHIHNGSVDEGVAKELQYPNKTVPEGAAAEFWKDAYMKTLRLQADWRATVKNLSHEAGQEIVRLMPLPVPEAPPVTKEALDAIRQVRIDLEEVRGIHDEIARSDQRSLVKDHAIAAVLFALATVACINRAINFWV